MIILSSDNSLIIHIHVKVNFITYFFVRTSSFKIFWTVHTIITYGILPHCFCGYKSVGYRSLSSGSNVEEEFSRLCFVFFFFCWGGTQNLLAIYSHGLTGLKTEVRVLKQWNSRLPKLFPKLSQRPLLNYRKYLGKKIKIQPMMSQKMMLKTYSNTNFWMHLNVMRPSISWNKSRLNVVKSLL